MHILIDHTHGRVIARHEQYIALAALHYIQFHDSEASIVRCDSNRAYAALDEVTLRACLRNEPGVTAATKYSDLIRKLRERYESDPAYLLPYDADHLTGQARKLHPSDWRAMRYMPKGTDAELAVRPHGNVLRAESTFAINFASEALKGQTLAPPLPKRSTSPTLQAHPMYNQPEEPSMSAKKTPAKKSAPTKKSAPAKKAEPAKKVPAKKTAPAKTAPAKAPKATKVAVDRDTQNGVTRPRPGGNTAAVWEAADVITAKKGSAATFKEIDAKLDASEKTSHIPTATRRSNYAVWRKYNGITGRVTE